MVSDTVGSRLYTRRANKRGKRGEMWAFVAGLVAAAAALWWVSEGG